MNKGQYSPSLGIAKGGQALYPQSLTPNSVGRFCFWSQPSTVRASMRSKWGLNIKGAMLATVIIVSLTGVGHSEEVKIDMARIQKIESSGNPRAYNKGSGARGLYQITPICLKEYNNFHPKAKYSLNDLFNPEVNTKVATWYFDVRIPQLLKYYKKPVTIENVLWAYNAGIGKVVKSDLPDETRHYISKYQRR